MRRNVAVLQDSVSFSLTREKGKSLSIRCTFPCSPCLQDSGPVRLISAVVKLRAYKTMQVNSRVIEGI